MKIGLIADSHDNLPMIRAAVEVFTAAGVEAVLRAGDIIAPFAAKEFLAADLLDTHTMKVQRIELD